MKTSEFYYLIMVCGAFALFAVSLGVNCMHYRRALKVKARR